MRVLLLTTPLAPEGEGPANGATLAAVDLARALAASGRAEPVLLARPGALVPEGCDSLPILTRRTRDLEALASIVRARADVVHAIFAPRPSTGIALAALTRLARAPLVQTVASRPRTFARHARSLPGRVVISTSAATTRALRAAGLADDRLVELPLPFTPRAAARDLELPAERPRGCTLLFAGDYEFGDALEPTLEAFAQLAPPRGLPVTLLIAARAKTPRARAIEAALRDRVARSSSLRGRVRVLGEVRSLLPWILSSSAVLLPARDLYAKLDHPRVLLEALSLGVPIVVGPAPSLGELVREGGDGGEGAEGIGEIARDAPALREAMERALVRPPLDVERALAVLGRRRAEVIAEAHLALYARVTSGA